MKYLINELNFENDFPTEASAPFDLTILMRISIFPNKNFPQNADIFSPPEILMNSTNYKDHICM